jgi:hypothetical protein
VAHWEQWWLIREQWWLIRKQWWLIQEQWWLIGWEQWWLIGGSSGGSLVATPDCDTAFLGSNPAISPAYSGLPVLRWDAIWDGTSL